MVMVNYWGERAAIFLLIAGCGSLFAALALPRYAQGATIKVEEIKAAIVRHVENSMPWAAGTVRVDFPGKLADMEVPGEPGKLEVQNRPNEDYIGDGVFSVKFYSGEVFYKEEKVRVALEVLRDCVVSARFLAKNKGIAADDVRVVKKWVKRLPPNVIASPAEIIGKALTMNLQPDTEIIRSNIKALLLIKKGSVVRILFDNGFLNVSTVGISEEDGATDALIRVNLNDGTSHEAVWILGIPGLEVSADGR
jgi:flagella basal body P-ring formation protein FlgA